VALIKRAKQAGAVGWIVKPFNSTQLVQTVSHLTGVSIGEGVISSES
jgi:FixJ family two-component response regulator